MPCPAEKLEKEGKLDRFDANYYQLQQQLALLEETGTGDRSRQYATRSCISDRKSFKGYFNADEDQWRGIYIKALTK